MSAFDRQRQKDLNIGKMFIDTIGVDKFENETHLISFLWLSVLPFLEAMRYIVHKDYYIKELTYYYFHSDNCWLTTHLLHNVSDSLLVNINCL
jgi:hypothetical protein